MAQSHTRPGSSLFGKKQVVPNSGVDDSSEDLAELLHEMVAAWGRGERPLAEDFLARHPELWDQPEAAAELIYEEICLREQYGASVSASALIRRFPQWQPQLEVLLDCQRLFEPELPPRFPAAGDCIGDFRLLAELGRGSGGLVFLATQPLLADRPVVLKLTPSAGSEHLRLARLQHTHIVPLFAAQDDPERRIRALCMPYFGGASLAHLLAKLDPKPHANRRGKDLLDALDQIQAAAPLAIPTAGVGRHLLERATYVQAVCWIGNCLANALNHAHEQGLVHLDLKPSNVLLTAAGQPMLLDFHLARAPLAARGTPSDGVGGTPNFMSPEQQAAQAAVRQGRPIPMAVDARSDIYSLGVLLCEALAGPSHVAPGAVQQLRRTNQCVSAGLAAILSRCLATDPSNRYPDAAALAADLQCHLQDLPLRGVPNRSPAERWRKWRRRRPYAFPLALILMAVMTATLGVILCHCRHEMDQSCAALAEGKVRFHEQRYAEAVHAAERGLRSAAQVPFFHTYLTDELHDLRRQADQARMADERARAATELHRLADQVRLLLGSNALPLAARRNLETTCQSFWERRALILAHLSGTSQRQTETVRLDLLDLALFWVDLRVTLARDQEKEVAWLEALRVLAEVEKLFGANPALLHRRELYATAAGLKTVAQEAGQRRASLTPQTAWEYVALGRSVFEAGDPRLAASYFEEALALQPTKLWPNFGKGLSCCRLEEYEEAVVAFSVCIGLAPGTAGCYYNRACAYVGCGQFDRALRDLDLALELEPQLAAAIELKDHLLNNP